MTTRRKWVLGSVTCMVVVLAIAGYQFDTQYEMGQIVLPWQKTRRRMRAARSMFGGNSGSRFVKFMLNNDPEETEARERRNRAACDKLRAAWIGYIDRCVEAKEAERARVHAEAEDLVTHGLPEAVRVCDASQASAVGPPDEQVDSCIAFFKSGTCDILDYSPNDLVIGEMDVMMKKPTRPQPHLQACPLLFL